MPVLEILSTDASGKSQKSHVDAGEIEVIEEQSMGRMNVGMTVLLKRNGREVGKYMNVTGYQEMPEQPAAEIVEGNNPW